LWAVAFVISCIYIKSPEMDLRIGEDGKMINAFEDRQERRKQAKQAKLQKQKESKLKQVLAEQRASQDQIRQKHNVPSKEGSSRKSKESSSNYRSHRGGISV
jgi:hypothetical protein